MTRDDRQSTGVVGEGRLCLACGSSTINVEFRDQFLRGQGAFDPRSNGLWFVCAKCGEEWPGNSSTIFGAGEPS